MKIESLKVRPPRFSSPGLRGSSTSSPLSQFGWLLLGAFVGAVGMFILDPASGRRRRAFARSKMVGVSNDFSKLSTKTGHDLSNRTQGLMAMALRSLHGRELPSNEKLVQQIRAEMGHRLKHAKAVEVSVKDGEVSLYGYVLPDEVDELIMCVEKVYGVKRVINHLEIRQSL